MCIKNILRRKFSLFFCNVPLVLFKRFKRQIVQSTSALLLRFRVTFHLKYGKTLSRKIDSFHQTGFLLQQRNSETEPRGNNEYFFDNRCYGISIHTEVKELHMEDMFKAPDKEKMRNICAL